MNADQVRSILLKTKNMLLLYGWCQGFFALGYSHCLVGALDEAVAVEIRPVLGADEVGELAAAKIRHGVGQPHPHRVQPGPVEPLRAEDRVVDEGFGSGHQLGDPERGFDGIR